MTHECDGCKSDLTDDRVTEHNGGYYCEFCVQQSITYTIFVWGDNNDIARIFPQQSDIREAA